jgi:hypothetical protein
MKLAGQYGRQLAAAQLVMLWEVLFSSGSYCRNPARPRLSPGQAGKDIQGCPNAVLKACTAEEVLVYRYMSV